MRECKDTKTSTRYDPKYGVRSMAPILNKFTSTARYLDYINHQGALSSMREQLRSLTTWAIITEQNSEEYSVQLLDLHMIQAFPNVSSRYSTMRAALAFWSTTNDGISF
jgi:hypothetical protein